MFDTHTHIQFKVFDDIRDRVIDQAKKAGVEKIIAVGTNLETSKKALEISRKYPEVYASIGIHPHHVFQYKKSNIKYQNDIEKIKSLISDPKVVAIGETGMDKHIYENTKYPNYLISKEFIKLQKLFFEEQIKLAIKYKVALIIHNREAVSETLEVLEKNWDPFLSGRSVFHFCEPDIRLLDFAIKNHIFISFGGDITYNEEKQDFLKKVPLELLVLETDSPFFTPTNLTSPNTPANLKVILEKVSEILKVSKEKPKQITSNNSKTLFQLLT